MACCAVAHVSGDTGAMHHVASCHKRHQRNAMHGLLPQAVALARRCDAMHGLPGWWHDMMCGLLLQAVAPAQCARWCLVTSSHEQPQKSGSGVTSVGAWEAWLLSG